MMFRCNCDGVKGGRTTLSNLTDGLASVEILKVDVVQLAVDGNDLSIIRVMMPM